ncbi:MAG: leucine-rich repeat domain-containing protein [Clostridia bacterium]|nr:leucine-rich repeat domain-containing protein [Clostridia bacterium]
MKKWTLLCILLTALLAAGCACAASSGTCGDSLTWYLDDSGTLTVSGTGVMQDYRSDLDPVNALALPDAPWAGEKQKITAAVIQPGVYGIGDCAFSGCAALKQVTVPEGTARIGAEAFRDCAALKSVTLPASVMYLGNMAFQGCAALEQIALPEGVVYLGIAAFSECPALKSAALPEGMEEIPDYAFSGCSALERLILPESLLRAGRGAFPADGVKSVYYAGTKTQAQQITGPEEEKGILAKSSWHYGYGHNTAKITAQPEDAAVSAAGETAAAEVKATGDGLTYQWYVKDPGQEKFSKSSVTAAKYSVALKESSDGRQLYCVVSDQYGNSVKSKTVTLRIMKPLAITVQPSNARVKKAGDTAEVSVTATGDGLTYQWYLKDPGKTDYKASSVQKAVYSTSLTAAKDGRMLYCVITDAYGNQVQTRTVRLSIE